MCFCALTKNEKIINAARLLLRTSILPFLEQRKFLIISYSQSQLNCLLTQSSPDHGILQARGDIEYVSALGGAESLGREEVAHKLADEDAIAAAGAEGELPPLARTPDGGKAA